MAIHLVILNPFVLFIIQALFQIVSCLSYNESHYDYIIVGGGTSGLVVANRLSENPAITVAVIEAGDSVFNNPNVTNTTTFGLSLGTSIDWAYSSTLQIYAGNETQIYHAGKALGGTSTINGTIFISLPNNELESDVKLIVVYRLGMTYLRAQNVEIDAWEELGNTGWNWAELWPYYKKSEYFQRPNSKQRMDGAAFNSSMHGSTGPVPVGWSSTMMGGDAHAIVNATWQNLGIPYRADANGGEMLGFTVWPFTLNASTDIRADAARDYYWPISKRPNLKVFTNTLANRLTWSATFQGNKSLASGVNITTADGVESTLFASREIILSAGSLRSPLLLENSGVGNPTILQKYSIPVQIALPRVGENLQDQSNVYMYASANTSFEGYPSYATYTSALDLFGNKTSAMEAYVYQSIPAFATTIAEQSNNSTSQAAQETLLRKQADLIFKSGIPMGEILTVPSATSIGATFWSLFPFSRGGVHISSKNISASPLINPNFFMLDWDIIQQAAVARFTRKVLYTKPLSNYVNSETSPGVTTVPFNASDQAWGEWFKEAYGPNSHPLGTAAMMAKELGGVVDSKLVVYGTSNVRVVDASVLPFQVCGHLSSTLYAIAEKAADMIKVKWND
ncbi:MAG: hypothetical protein M1834_008905 [Cirrosporium novae-zelandiae]|nr:MAG: hypothetical protein M1834_008905 [Cirrosporium novae-zelandiae]